MREKRADVQEPSDLELYVYDAVASADTGGRAVGDAEIAEIAADAGRGEDEVRRALDRLVRLNHVRSHSAGYALGPHDWSP
jgi:DNA-binding IclR family transcriptional regulator